MRGHLQPGFGLYLPSAWPRRGGLPLLVMLHGCRQDAQSFATGTGMNRVAEREGFAVLYPEQDPLANPLRCWNWFRAEVMRGEGESQALVRLVRRIRDRYGLDAQRVYVAGMSAGAAMAQVLAVRHPELFAAAALHSGVMYGASATPWLALSTMRHGSPRSPSTLARSVRAELGPVPCVPTLLIHGQQDDVVVPRNALQAAEQIRDLAAPAVSPDANPPAMKETFMLEGGRRCSVQEWQRDGRPLVRVCLVDGLGHAWSGGDASLPYNDAAGPDASRLIWEFVAPFRRAAVPARGDAGAPAGGATSAVSG